MGLDPPNTQALSHLLHDFTEQKSPRLVLALRPQDALPEWITHLVYLRASLQIAHQGSKEDVLKAIGETEPTSRLFATYFASVLVDAKALVVHD